MTSEAEVKQCYTIDSDDNALNCIKQVVRNTSGDCKPRIVLLVREGCDGCREEKARYKSDIDSGIINVVDIFSSEGKEIARKNDIDAVPAVLIVDCHDLAIE